MIKNDPWAAIVSRNGYAGDELISMLQKSIRRGLEENALNAAYEMYITSPQFEDKLWRRLMMICIEDVGFGDRDICNTIYTLNLMRKEFPYNDGDRPFFFVHAIRMLIRCKKERSSDHVKNMLNHNFATGKKWEVPEYALDMHTVRGREMGRDSYHFLTEASRVENYCGGEEEAAIFDEFKKMLEEKETAERLENAFNFSDWQF